MKKPILMITGILISGWGLLLLFSGTSLSGNAGDPDKIDSRLGTEIFIKGGPYFIGNDQEKDNRPIRRVTFKGFFMDVHPVVNLQYARFLDESHYQPRGKFDAKTAKKYPLLPATAVTYADACAYARFYHKRLPSEWEWEIAARSLKKETVYATGVQPTLETGNFFRYKQRNGRTPVFRYHPNALGIYDMAGNVFEWTSSVYTGKQFVGKHHSRYRLMVLRGGAWTSIPSDVRVTSRTPFPASRFLDWIGFRCVRDAQGD